MRSFLLTILFIALCGLTHGSSMAQQTPPPVRPVSPVHPAPVVRPAPKPPKVKVKDCAGDPDGDPDADEDNDQEEQGQTEQTVASAPTVVVSICGGASRITVRGWDRNEVHARVESGETIELNSHSTGTTNAPASQVEVTIFSGDVRHRRRGGTCHSNGDVQLDVPRSAVLDIRTMQGDIDVEYIAHLHAESMAGNFTIRNITKSIDATSGSGDVTVERARGSLNVSSMSGTVDVRDAESGEAGDRLEAISTSGDVTLTNCNYGQVRANSTSGNVFWTGPLSSGGRYEFSTTSSDIFLVMPGNSSFRVVARAAFGGDISTDFALRSERETSLAELSRQVRGVYGSGSAQLEIMTFSGSIRLRKKM
jgi:DUF4097 and DUF4098 domain-containing protein YvlB